MSKPSMPKAVSFVIALIAVFLYFVIDGIKSNPGTSSSSPSNTVTPSAPTTFTSSGKYMLNFSDSFNAALASQDDLGLSIVIAIDCSGSMEETPSGGSSTRSKYLIANDSLKEIISFIHKFYNENVKNENLRLRLSVIKFSGSVKVLFPLSDITDESFARLNEIVGKTSNFLPDGKTALGETLETGTELLVQSETIFKSLIVITDGANTTGVEPETVLDAIVNSDNNKNNSDFPVLTNSVLVSFIGFDVNMNSFSRLNRLGARITSAADKEELNENLKALFLADITKLEAN